MLVSHVNSFIWCNQHRNEPRSNPSPNRNAKESAYSEQIQSQVPQQLAWQNELLTRTNEESVPTSVIILKQEGGAATLDRTSAIALRLFSADFPHATTYTMHDIAHQGTSTQLGSSIHYARTSRDVAMRLQLYDSPKHW